MVFEDAVAGLSSLGQPYVRLPRRGPSRASVRRIVAIFLGDRSDRSAGVQNIPKPYLSHPESKLDIPYMHFDHLDGMYIMVKSNLPFGNLTRPV